MRPAFAWLGGQRNDALRLILGRGAKMAALGVAVGIAGSLALTGLMAYVLQTRFKLSLLYLLRKLKFLLQTWR
jgi:hypothetical protein